MFNDVLQEELEFFVGKVAKGQGIARGLIKEFVSRTLQRLVYGTATLGRTKLIPLVWVLPRNSFAKPRRPVGIFERSLNIITSPSEKNYDNKSSKLPRNGNQRQMCSAYKINYRNRIFNIQLY